MKNAKATPKHLALARRHHGLSIMEVLFAIGVLTVGLLGVASVLPVATNNAARTLQRDRAIEQVNNQVSKELSRIGPAINTLVAPITLRSRVPTTGRTAGNRYFESTLSSLPNSFCIDPWFISSASNLRNDTGANPLADMNGYDRGAFPCYDTRFNPLASPANALQAAGGWNTPRFLRVAFNSPILSPAFKIAQSDAREADNISLFQPKDSTLPPGLFVQRSSPGGPTAPLSTTKVGGRLSSFVLMSRSSLGSNLFNTAIVTMQDRETTIVPGGGALGFQMAPYTAARADAQNPQDNELTYGDEVLGFVTLAPRTFIGGGGGEFTYSHSSFMSPKIKAGNWLMLARQQYISPPSSGGFNPVPMELHFAWYRVRSVTQEPTLASGGAIYQTTVSVDGPDWLFHPTQIQHPSDPALYGPPFTEPLTPPATVTVNSPGTYDFSVTGWEQYGTIVVVMPKVVSVHQMQIAL